MKSDFVLRFREEKNQEDYETLFDLALEEGVDGLLEMRSREGESLLKDINSHIALTFYLY